MPSDLPVFLEQPLDWFELHRGQRVFPIVRDWIFGPLCLTGEVDSYVIDDDRGRLANLSLVPGTDVIVTWRMKPSGQIAIIHIGKLGD